MAAQADGPDVAAVVQAWRTTPAVQGLSLEERGAWWEVLQLMAATTRPGYLVTPAGTAMRDAAIARNIGTSEANWKQIRSKLVHDGVANETADGVLYEPVLARDTDIREARRKAGSRGGRRSKPKAKRQAKAKQPARDGDFASGLLGGLLTPDRANPEAAEEDVASGLLTPEKPSPTSIKGSIKRTKGGRGGAGGAVELPQDFASTAAERQLAQQLGVDHDYEFDKFRDWARGGGKRKKDWRATWRNWIRRTAESRGGTGGGKATPQRFQYPEKQEGIGWVD